MNLPSPYEGTGSDHFQLLLERQMSAMGSSGNIGQFILRLSGDNMETLIRDRINAPIIQWIYKLKYSPGRLFGIPKWEHDEGIKLTNLLTVHDFAYDTEMDLAPSTYTLIPQKGGLIKIDLYKNKDNYTLIYTWHHTLSDARGAEYLALYIAGIRNDLKLDDLLPTIKQKPILELLQNARVAKNYLVAKREWKVNTLVDRKSARKSSLRYSVIDFTLVETDTIDAIAAKVIRWGRSAYLMGGCCFAFEQLVKRRGHELDSLLIPVPQDQRLKGSSSPILSNQVSYLFYRLLSEDCQSAEKAAKSISSQMMTQIKERIPHAYGDMMQLFKRLPLFIYNHLSKGPTKGAFASFYFSDTGDSLDQLIDKSESGITILDAIHLPPPSRYPGCTIVFMRLNKKLKFIISSTDISMSEEERLSFVHDLKIALLSK